jgi:hypothetical protein
LLSFLCGLCEDCVCHGLLSSVEVHRVSKSPTLSVNARAALQTNQTRPPLRIDNLSDVMQPTKLRGYSVSSPICVARCVARQCQNHQDPHHY